MNIDLRKVLRHVVNFLVIAAGLLAIPELGAEVPVGWLPYLAGAAGIVNLILSWIRAVNDGEPFLAK